MPESSGCHVKMLLEPCLACSVHCMGGSPAKEKVMAGTGASSASSQNDQLTVSIGFGYNQRCQIVSNVYPSHSRG